MTRRRWTAQDQITAEVAAACGMSYREISTAIGWSLSTVRLRLDHQARIKQREAVKKWQVNHPEVARKCGQRYRDSHREELRAKDRARIASDPERHRQSAKEWRAKNPEKVKKLSLKYRNNNLKKCRQRLYLWRKLNPDKIQAIRRRYYQQNRKTCITKSRIWAKANRERVRDLARIWREANRQRVRERSKVNAQLWRKFNPEKVRELDRRRKARIRASGRGALFALNTAQKKARFALWRNRCAFCGVNANHSRNLGYKLLTEEHVLALSKNGLDEADNIMPACATCNTSKNDSPIESWYRKQPFFTEARWRKICRHCPGAVIGQLPLAMPTGDQP
jgi:hypothetical protein